jgi:hypothetical protein
LGVPVVIYEDDQGELGSYIRAVPDGAGGIVVAWLDKRNYYPQMSIYCNRLDSSGESEWDVEGREVFSDEDLLRLPHLFNLNNGFLVMGSILNVGTYGKLLSQDGYTLWGYYARFLSQYWVSSVYYVKHPGPEFSGISWQNDFRATKFDTLGTDIWPDGVHLFDWDSRYNLIADGSGGIYALHSGFLQRVYADGHLGGDTTSIEFDEKLPGQFDLSLSNYPNPFNSSTIIRYSLTTQSSVILDIYNLLGQRVDRLLDGTNQSPGEYTITWNPQGLPSGMYFARVKSSEDVETAKLVYLK